MIKFDKLWEIMKKKGISTYTLREQYEFDSKTINRMRKNMSTTTYTLNKFCAILNCSLSEIAEYIPDENNENEKLT